MADAIGAEHAFFSTCGSSLSVKAAMLVVARGKRELLVSWDAHKSVVAGLIFTVVEPRWTKPRYDADLHLAHPPSPKDVDAAWSATPKGSRRERLIHLACRCGVWMCASSFASAHSSSPRSLRYGVRGRSVLVGSAGLLCCPEA